MNGNGLRAWVAVNKQDGMVKMHCMENGNGVRNNERVRTPNQRFTYYIVNSSGDDDDDDENVQKRAC